MHCKVANTHDDRKRREIERKEYDAASLQCHKNSLKCAECSVGHTKCNFYYPIM